MRAKAQRAGQVQQHTNYWRMAAAPPRPAPRTCSAPISGVHARCTLGSMRGVSGSGAAV